MRISPDDETTLKRFYAEGPVVRLQPENSQMEPIMVEADRVEVLSRVVAVWRYRGVANRKQWASTAGSNATFQFDTPHGVVRILITGSDYQPD